MKKLSIFLLANVILINFVFSQTGVSINTTGGPADNSAILDVSSTSQGLLIPRMTTSERNGIISPALSLLIFNTTTNCFEAYVNGNWYSVSCPPPCSKPTVPTSGTNSASQTQIVWNWNTVNGATGYKWSTANNYSIATDNGTNTSYTQIGLICNTSYTLYVWAYNSCGNSSPLILNQTTSSCVNTIAPCGTQVFMSTNLNAGNQISQAANQSNNQKWCYNDLPANCTTYGGLYQWTALGVQVYGTGLPTCDPCNASSTPTATALQGICPTGYHIPTDLEWSRYEYCVEARIAPLNADTSNAGCCTLTYFQTAAANWRGSSVPGVGPADKMKAKSTDPTPWNGTNTSGFSGLPGGNSVSGSSINLGGIGIFWSATVSNQSAAMWNHRLYGSTAQTFRSYDGMQVGFSVRCLQN
jgi:uncharacterized protein (TIGR02145 family)